MKEIRQIVENSGDKNHYQSFKSVYGIDSKSTVKYWLYAIIIFLAIILFLPWTQNIRAKGSVTTLRQEQRPQELNTIIAGKIIKWHVKEGDFVKKGDTIVQLAEIKDSYLDPKLLERTGEQLNAKSASIQSYQEKLNAYSSQIIAIEQAKNLKIEQLRNKLQQLQLKILSDSMDAIAANNDFSIAEEQYRRQKIMRDSGLASLVQLETRNKTYQNALAKKVSAEIKFTNAKTELTNTKIELNQVVQEYAEKSYKAQGERASAQSEIAAGQGELSKLSNQYANYTIRAGQYYLLAPQDGQVVKALKAGINEIVKEGEQLVEIVPQNIDLAVELFVRPVDLPLISIGQDVRLVFDGFPAIVFSGWPEASYGTFGGTVVAIENSITSNGKFRVLIGEIQKGKRWPKTLRMGTGASSIALIKDVPIYYELWRNINGFPPDYYEAKTKGDEKKKK